MNYDSELIRITRSLRGTPALSEAKPSRRERNEINSKEKVNQQTQNMQNKPNLLEAQINITLVKTKDYMENDAFSPPKNKPNRTQFQTRLRWTYFNFLLPWGGSTRKISSFKD